MLLGNIRGDFYPNCRSSRSAPHLATPSTSSSSYPINGFLSSPINSPSTNVRTPITPQQTMMNYARMSYRYTTVTLLSMRPQPELTVFPDHLVERRFLDEENFIDLDRMLLEKAGKFRLESYGMLDGAGDGPVMTSRVHKYDFSDPVVIEKVKNRRPKDPLTPHQVAALTSVVTRHQPSTLPTPLLSSNPNGNAQVWIDDYSRRQAQVQRPTTRHFLPPQPSMPYQRQNPNQCETYTNQSKAIFSSNTEENSTTVPILQRLFQAQQRQQNEQRKVEMEYPRTPLMQEKHSSFYPKDLSALLTPASPSPTNTFAWPFPTNATEKSATHPLHLSMSTQTTVKSNQNILSQLINDHTRCSTTMQTPVTPGVELTGLKSDDDDEQNFYSAPPSPTQTSTTSPEQTRIYNQAVLLNSLIRNMVNDQQQRVNAHQDKDSPANEVPNSSSNESCFSNESQLSSEGNESYAEMYNLIRLLSPGVKSVAQQELLDYLEQGCSMERDEMIRLVSSMNINEQNSLKPVLVRLINEQLDIMKQQENLQQGHSRSTLESWFGSDIYRNAYPRMPRSGRVISASDLEQSRLNQTN